MQPRWTDMGLHRHDQRRRADGTRLQRKLLFIMWACESGGPRFRLWCTALIAYSFLLRNDYKTSRCFLSSIPSSLKGWCWSQWCRCWCCHRRGRS